jgi:FixJ family two-component response regulator/tetratricopeptide (TPR) repeat protein
MESTKVLILDDDQALLSSLKAALVARGYEVYATHSTEDAKGLIQYNDIKVWIVDCLLPGENGVDFVKSLQKIGINPEYLILISGLFTDSSFIKDSMSETGAKDFLIKPFGTEKLLKALPTSTKGSQDSESIDQRRVLYQIFGNTKRDPRYLRKLFESLESIHGFDLPLIYSLIMESRISGFLNLSSEDGRIFGVNFADGEIVRVDLEDKETFLGKLLIEHGFLLSGDLDSVLSQKKSRKLGERLIQEHIISPHALDIAMSEQMGIRLSRTILDQDIKFNFSASPIDKIRPAISSELFNHYLHDWINSKLNLYWLRAQLTEWRYSQLKKTSNSEILLRQLKEYPLLRSHSEIIKAVVDEPILESLFEKFKSYEEELLKIIYLLLAKGAVYFEERDISEFTNKVEALRKLSDALVQLEPNEGIQFLANQVGSSTDNLEVLKMAVFNFLAPFEKSKNQDLKNQVGIIKTYARKHISESIGTIKSQEETLNASVEAMRLFEEGKSLLAKGQASEALKRLQESVKIYPRLPKQKLYLLWAQIRTLGAHVTPESIKELDAGLLKIDPEDKHEALFHFIQGLLMKLKSQNDLATKSFEKALALDPHFIEARRELIVLKSKTEVKKGSGLNADLKTLVGQLFSKKRP